MEVANSVLELIGNTPMVRLNKVTSGTGATILVKCEYLNPSGSIKDRIALRMIAEAEKAGKIKPGGTITEGSTGNTGIALSFVNAVKGYKSIIYMPKGWANPDRVKAMEAYGAEVREVSPGEEIERELKGKSVHGGVLELWDRIKCLELGRNRPNTWWARQALNPDNVATHRERTGKEILRQTGGEVDAFVAAVGTGGTLLGVAEALKEKTTNVKIYAVEPASSPLLEVLPKIQQYMEKYGIPGVRGWIIDEIKRRGIVDRIFLVKDKDAIGMAHRLCEEEGLFVGMSAGANVFVAMKVARKLGKGKTVVTVLPDRRDRYLNFEHFTT